MCIGIVCFPVCDSINFEIKRFSALPKGQNKKLNISKTKRAFKDEIKSIFHHF